MRDEPPVDVQERGRRIRDSRVKTRTFRATLRKSVAGNKRRVRNSESIFEAEMEFRILHLFSFGRTFVRMAQNNGAPSIAGAWSRLDPTLTPWM